MEKSLLEKLVEAKHENDTALVEFFNTGKIRTDENYMLKHLNNIDSDNSFSRIETTLVDSIQSYSRHYDFDSINLDLGLGIILNAEDVIDKKRIKPNAQPIDGIVRFYTGSVQSILNGKQTNDIDFGEICHGRQGFIVFDDLMNKIKHSGLQYIGPQSFEELKSRILNDEKFTISLKASLVENAKAQEEIVTEEVIEEKPVEIKSKIKSLFRR